VVPGASAAAKSKAIMGAAGPRRGVADMDA